MALDRREFARRKGWGLLNSHADNERADLLENDKIDAHNRFTRRMQRAVESNPNSYSPEYQRRFLDEKKDDYWRERRLDHETELEKMRIEGNVAAARGQGADAAKFRADADKEIATGRNNTELEKWRLENGEGGTKDRLAEKQSQTELEKFRMEHGYTDKDGNYHPGSKERIAGMQIEGQKDVATINRETEIAKADQAAAKQQRDIAAKIQQSQIAAGQKADAAKTAAHAKIISSALQAGALNGKPPEVVIAELKNQYKDDPEMSTSLQIVGGGSGGSDNPAVQAPNAGQGGPEQAGYSPERIKAIQKRGYKWNGRGWVK